MRLLQTSRFTIGMVAGILMAWLIGVSGTRPLGAIGSDRYNERVMVTGSVIVEQDKNGQTWTQEAIYVLNKSTAQLLVAVPDYKKTVNSTQILTDFAERDLAQDFTLAPGSNPHFLMTTLNIGRQGQGWSPLLVLETETGQVNTYRVEIQVTQKSNRPLFQLVDRRVDPRLARSVAAANAEPGR